MYVELFDGCEVDEVVVDVHDDHVPCAAINVGHNRKMDEKNMLNDELVLQVIAEVTSRSMKRSVVRIGFSSHCIQEALTRLHRDVVLVP